MKLQKIEKTFLQILCTGTYYEQWVQEKDKFPTNNLIYLVCILLKIIMDLWTAKAKKNFTPVIPFNNQNTTNFGTRKTIWLSVVFLSIFLVSLLHLQTLDPIKLNLYPYKISILIVQGLFPTIFLWRYVILLISKSPPLVQRIKTKFS